MYYFLRFMGWLILYSFLYFLSLDIMGFPPGQEVTVFQKVFNFGFVPLVSVPVWLLTWKKFASVFGPNPPATTPGGETEYTFALRNPALKYYLMGLKLFLMVMGANGIIALDHYEGGTRIFYICNFVVLYLYAPTFFIIHVRKLKKAIRAKVLQSDQTLRLVCDGQTVSEIPLNSIQRVVVEEEVHGMLIEGAHARLYLGGAKAKGSPFYLVGVEQLWTRLKQRDPKIQNTTSIKKELKEAAFKPYV